LTALLFGTSMGATFPLASQKFAFVGGHRRLAGVGTCAVPKFGKGTGPVPRAGEGFTTDTQRALGHLGPMFGDGAND